MAVPYIVDAIRTPMARGKQGGALSSVHPVELLAATLKALVEANGIDPGMVDDVLIGCVSQVGEQSNNPGRMALLAAGFPTHVPATTIERKCGSSQQAIHFAAQGIASGAYDIAIAGGIESMSRIPMGSARLGMDIFGPTLNARHAPGFVSQGVAAELVARQWGITRAEMDTYAAASHARAEATRAAGGFDREIAVILTPDGQTVARDETIRPGTSVEGLAGLKAVFETDALRTRFPEVDFGVTSGNSSQLTDGAAAVLLMSEAAVARLGLKPRARFVAFDVVGDDPLMMLTAPIPATRRVLHKAGMKAGEIDHYEVNEAFASVPLAWNREIGVDPARLNPRGGAIALGHPLGASGARLMTTMLNALEQTGGRYGLQTMCEAGGMANATIIERL
jgi:acetyl-CoA acetyltransferase family protein